MNFIDFHKQWAPYGCFNIHQIYAWRPDFNRLNLRNWIKKGYLIKLRKEFYAFTENLSVPGFNLYLSNRLYRPSYISLYSALSFYGMIPEAVPQVMNVTPLKTISFQNDFGNFTYRSVNPKLMFGFKGLQQSDGKNVLIATPEKALIDLLYLYPFYKSPQDMLDLRLDEDFMVEEFDRDLFQNYCHQTDSKALCQRVNTLLNTYSL